MVVVNLTNRNLSTIGNGINTSTNYINNSTSVVPATSNNNNNQLGDVEDFVKSYNTRRFQLLKIANLVFSKLFLILNPSVSVHG